MGKRVNPDVGLLGARLGAGLRLGVFRILLLGFVC
jgi:hypothetical protein